MLRLLRPILHHTPTRQFVLLSMPPKRTASSSKRKASPESPALSDVSDSAPVAKKAKTTKKKTHVPNGQPTNKVMPSAITFEPKHPGTLRLSAWNVSGLNASLKKSFKTYVEAEDPDILVLTETKVNDKPQNFLIGYPHQYWSISSQKGYAGTAVLSKFKPLDVRWDLPGHEKPGEAAKGRLVVLEFANSWVVATYVPNAGQNLKNIDYKVSWNEAFAKYIHTLNEKKPVIWMGDLNCAPTPLDLTNSKTNWNKTPGHTQAETDGFNKILGASSDSASESGSATNSGSLVDVWRHLHPDVPHYTYFSYKFNCREKSIGWRLDMFVVSKNIIPRIKMCEIRSDIYGASDHCPIVLEIEEGAL